MSAPTSWGVGGWGLRSGPCSSGSSPDFIEARTVLTFHRLPVLSQFPIVPDYLNTSRSFSQPFCFIYQALSSDGHEARRTTKSLSWCPVTNIFRVEVAAYRTGQERLVGEIGSAGVLGLETLCAHEERAEPDLSPALCTTRTAQNSNHVLEFCPFDFDTSPTRYFMSAKFSLMKARHSASENFFHCDLNCS